MVMDKQEFINNYKPFGNDMISELVDTFQKDYPNKMKELKEATSHHHFDQIRKLSHSIKGSVGIFHANETRELAFELEMAGKNEDSGKIDELFSSLENSIRELDDELTQLKASLSG